MKSKNIPADIRSKSINEAQSEIKEIIDKLESPEANLKDSMDQYNLDHHIRVGNKYSPLGHSRTSRCGWFGTGILPANEHL